jgi:radical SAM protein with 4Fe4S-binding SPASM domain
MNRSLTDAINLLSKINGRKLLNMIRLLSGYYVSKTLGTARQWGMPFVMEIEPTTSCNLRCPQCPSGLRSFTRDTGMLTLPLFKKVIDELHPDLVYLLLYFQGEPFLNKQFLDFVRYASGKNIYTATSSNAHYFTDELAKETVLSGLDRLIISIDGTTQESYAEYRKGGDLGKVIAGTERLLKWKKELNRKTPHIIWQMIAFRHNEHEIPAIRRLAAEVGVDELGIKTAQIYDYREGSGLIPENETLSRYARTSDGFRIKNSLPDHCWKMWKGSVVTWDGKVVPCCFDKDATHRLGDVNSQSFREIWQGSGYTAFRNAVLRSRSSIDICTNCSEGAKVWS